MYCDVMRMKEEEKEDWILQTHDIIRTKKQNNTQPGIGSQNEMWQAKRTTRLGIRVWTAIIIYYIIVLSFD